MKSYRIVFIAVANLRLGVSTSGEALERGIRAIHNSNGFSEFESDSLPPNTSSILKCTVLKLTGYDDEECAKIVEKEGLKKQEGEANGRIIYTTPESD